MFFEALGEILDVLRRPAGMSMPRCRPMPASTSLISLSDLRPKFGVRSISPSDFWIRSPM
ncbi:hypothetical protein SR39_11190 [Methylobacterium radiotolerans]|nr:hypothetical protein SR39_11190 [Methylobacterium radiotolerans]